MRVIPIRTRQVPSKSRRQAHAIVFELRANRKLTSETACLQRIRPSGGIHSAHAGVSNKPRATNAAQHGWIQNATKWLDRDEVRSREPRHSAEVDYPVQTVPVRATHQCSADETVDGTVVVQASADDLHDPPKGAIFRNLRPCFPSYSSSF